MVSSPLLLLGSLYRDRFCLRVPVLVMLAGFLWCGVSECMGKELPARKRVLLIGQGPDGHPWSTHEYMAGVRLLAHFLQQEPNIQVIVVQADDPWKEGPELLAGADAVVLFVSEGAKWIQGNPERYAAFEDLAQRGGGLTVLHWGMGCKDANYIEGFVKLFGGCHGGPDRKYKVLTTTTRLASPDHPIANGLEPGEVKEEFYYTLKFAQPQNDIVPILQARIEDEFHTVAWAWERSDKGRSFGFSGLHFHDNWKEESYRRMVLQGVLWTLNREIPAEGISVKVPSTLLKLPASEQPRQ